MEALSVGIPWTGGAGGLMWPQLTTVPMGWSHAVYVAQLVNETCTVVYRSGVLSRSRNSVTGAVPTLTSPLTQCMSMTG